MGVMLERMTALSECSLLKGQTDIVFSFKAKYEKYYLRERQDEDKDHLND